MTPSEVIDFARERQLPLGLNQGIPWRENRTTVDPCKLVFDPMGLELIVSETKIGSTILTTGSIEKVFICSVWLLELSDEVDLDLQTRVLLIAQVASGPGTTNPDNFA